MAPIGLPDPVITDFEGMQRNFDALATRLAIYESLIFWGTGSPENVVTANPGAIYHNRSGGAATSLYKKESGTAKTGWVAF